MKILNDSQGMLNVLAITSIVMFISLFTFIPKIIAITMTLWLLSIGGNLRLILFSGNHTLYDLVEANENKITKAKAEKKHIERGVHTMALPLCVVGLIFIGMTLMILFTM